MKQPQPKVLIAVPTMGSIHSILVSRLLLWSKQFKDTDLSYYFTFRVSPHDRARNELVEFFLNQPQLTHIFFVDSDTIPPADALMRLLAHDLPFVTALTPIMRRDGPTNKLEIFDNCFLEPIRDEDGKIVQTNITPRNQGLQKIYRCGSACMLVKREVFEKLPRPYFKFETDPDNLRHTRSEDIYFCDQMREAGYELWADSDVYCQHQKDLMI